MRCRAVVAVVCIVLGLMVAPVSPAAAADCPSVKPGGRAIGAITVGDVRVPIKPVSYPKGGVLEPPPSHLVAGLSTRHAGLEADRGTSVLVWHVRYGKGCDGALNGLLDLGVGDTFVVTGRSGEPRSYRVTETTSVPLGKYRRAWFDQRGPHRLALFTCEGIVDGRFTRTRAILADPVGA